MKSGDKIIAHCTNCFDNVEMEYRYTAKEDDE